MYKDDPNKYQIYQMKKHLKNQLEAPAVDLDSFTDNTFND